MKGLFLILINKERAMSYSTKNLLVETIHAFNPSRFSYIKKEEL